MTPCCHCPRRRAIQESPKPLGLLDPPLSRGTTAEIVAAHVFTDSTFKQPSVTTPILCGAGYAVVPFLIPRTRRGGRRADRRCHSLWARTIAGAWRLSARHRGFLSPWCRSFRAGQEGAPHLAPLIRRASARLRSRRVQPSRGSRSWCRRTGSQGLPGAGLRDLRAGAASGSIIESPRDDALCRAGRIGIYSGQRLLSSGPFAGLSLKSLSVV